MKRGFQPRGRNAAGEEKTADAATRAADHIALAHMHTASCSACHTLTNLPSGRIVSAK